MHKKKKILLYGLQRSGTNYTETLLKKHFKVHFLNSNKDRSAPNQKHFRIYDNKELIPEPQYKNNIVVKSFKEFNSLFNEKPDNFLVISKDPYSWYLSYNKWAIKCDWPKINHHYIQEYNAFYKKWISFSNETDNIIFIRYIDILHRTREELRRIQEKAGLVKKTLSIYKNININKVSQSGYFDEKKVDYYLNKKYINDYNKNELLSINSLIDKEVIDVLGYNIIDKYHGGNLV